jgi:hypothetical protein
LHKLLTVFSIPHTIDVQNNAWPAAAQERIHARKRG